MRISVKFRIALFTFGVLVAFGRPAAACPFCGGSDAEPIESLVVFAVLGFGARALWRAMQRRRARRSEPSAPIDEP